MNDGYLREAAGCNLREADIADRAVYVAIGRIAVLPAKQIPWGRPGAATTGSCACSRSSTALRTSPISSIRDADDGSELIGRPLGDEAFLDAISLRLNRVVTPA